MSEPYEPNDPRDAEEQAILAAFTVLEAADPEQGLEEAFGASGSAGAPGEGAEAATTLRRLYVETLGLLAWDAPAEAPPDRLKGRLMAVIGPAGAAAATASAADPETPPAGVVPIAPGGGAEEAAPSERRGTPWLTALAALFAVAALGLSGWLYTELDRARETLSRLEGDRARLAERLDQQEDLIRRRGGMDEILSAVSTAGVEICPLRPVGDPALHPQAFAVLYMPPGSGEWYLLASNLEPGPGVYKVWLNTPQGARPVGLLDPDTSTLQFELPPDVNERHELMLSIVVTLEPSPDMPDPSGPMVLFGDQVMKVL